MMKKDTYIVVFKSTLNPNHEGYAEMSKKMEEQVKTMPGFLSVCSARSEIGITLSYWDSLEHIKNWKENKNHLEAQRKGNSEWYAWYEVEIAKVIHSYSKG